LSRSSKLNIKLNIKSNIESAKINKHSPSAFQSSSNQSRFETISSCGFQLFNCVKTTQIQRNARIGQCTSSLLLFPTRNCAFNPFWFKFLKLNEINIKKS
jgi:hypothetical protein